VRRRLLAAVALLAGGSLALLGGGASAPPAPAAAARPPADDKALLADIRKYLALDELTAESRTARGELLAQIDAASPDPLTGPQVKNWSKKILEAWEDGPKLEKKGGRHYLWEKDEKGLYIVGGEEKKPKGLFIGMHGGGAGAGDAGEMLGEFDNAVSKQKWLGIYPEVLEKTEHGWTDSGSEEFVLELVERARRSWNIDPDHVYLGGHSMGGYGSWMLGGHHADAVAALAISAGAPTPYTDASGQATDIIEGVVPNLRNVTMVVYQSADDPKVPPAANRTAMKRIEEARARWGGYPVEYWEVPANQHEAPPGGFKALLEKIAKAERTPRPDKVIWQPTLEWWRRSYWLWWETPAINALVEAELDKPKNTVRVKCDKPAAGLIVLLDERTLDVAKEVVVELNGTESWRGMPQARLSTLVLSGARGDPELMFAYRVPVQK
jgi:poly(3-hydroxybutyrate) depolymerase